MVDFELSNDKYRLFYKNIGFESIKYNAIDIATSLRKKHQVMLKDIMKASNITPTLYQTNITFKNKEDAIHFVETTNSMILINKLKECV